MALTWRVMVIMRVITTPYSLIWSGYSRFLVLNFRIMVLYLELFNVISCSCLFMFHFDSFLHVLKESK
ncbi:hypothetical protein HanIR_Chr01g0004231 [Helianthus annuus]|nr:hypothetical protein HanIR_Chr01g0004231 [Helianthus annuus]